jgi:septal ring factor EnvC (AmiA/AmiB activator)
MASDSRPYGSRARSIAEAYKGGRFKELKALYAEKEKLISVSVSETQAVEDMRKEFGGSIANLVMENREVQKKIEQLEKDLKYAIEECEELD